jgi:hypothetical protein
MLDIFRQWLLEQGAVNIELAQADVLKLEALPSHWRDYDLIVVSTMLEYLPKQEVRQALVNLRLVLRHNGILLIFLTKRNLMTRWLAVALWKTNVYSEREIQALLRDAGFQQVAFKRLSPGWANSIMAIEAQQPLTPDT